MAEAGVEDDVLEDDEATDSLLVVEVVEIVVTTEAGSSIVGRW